MLKYLHHVHYIVRNRDIIVAYMERNFWLKPESLEQRESGLGKGNRDATFRVGQTLIDITEPTDPTTPHGQWLAQHGPGVWHVAWAVDDIDSLAKRLVAQGSRLLGGPVGFSEGNEGVTISHWGYKHTNIDPEDSAGILFQLIEETN